MKNIFIFSIGGWRIFLYSPWGVWRIFSYSPPPYIVGKHIIMLIYTPPKHPCFTPQSRKVHTLRYSHFSYRNSLIETGTYLVSKIMPQSNNHKGIFLYKDICIRVNCMYLTGLGSETGVLGGV